MSLFPNIILDRLIFIYFESPHNTPNIRHFYLSRLKRGIKIILKLGFQWAGGSNPSEMSNDPGDKYLGTLFNLFHRWVVEQGPHLTTNV